MDAPKGFLLNHLDGQGFRGHTRGLLRVEKPCTPAGQARAGAAALDEAVAWEHEVSGGTYGLLASAMLWRARVWMWVCVRSPRRCAAKA